LIGVFAAVVIAWAQPVGSSAPTPAAAQLPPAPSAIPATRQLTSTSIQDFIRLGGHGEFPLRGIGIVVGLNGTGDSGTELAVAQPLAALYERGGNPMPDLAALGKAKSAAIVWVDCTIPEQGARENDRFDVYVSAMHSASSLKGGRLIITPLTEIRLDNPDVFAFASGAITIESADSPRVGKIHGGAQMARPVMHKIGDEFVDLIVQPPFRAHSTTRVIASEINGLRANLEDTGAASDPIAFALDDTTVRVSIPEEDRADPTNFLASILTKSFSPDLLDLPAMVVINRASKKLIITGDVEISAVTVGSERLQFTTITPAQPPSPTSPRIERDEFAAFGTTARGSERARIDDLLAAFRALNIPFTDQVDLIEEIHRSGRLNARLIRN
jgi:flagellar P-ring protein precursor FlgI